jgi:hypothetical protein
MPTVSSRVKSLAVFIGAAAAFAPMLGLYLRLITPTIDHAMVALVAFLVGIVIVCLGRKWARQ